MSKRNCVNCVCFDSDGDINYQHPDLMFNDDRDKCWCDRIIDGVPRIREGGCVEYVEDIEVIDKDN